MSKKVIKITMIVTIILTIFILGVFALLHYSIKLNGQKVVHLALNAEYHESGAEMNFFKPSSAIKVIGEVNSSKVGTYKIKYETKILGNIKVSRTRIVEVVDEISPTITLVGSETVNVCDDGEYQEEGYEATDNYDGDLTDKVVVEREDDIIFYTVKDTSNNSVTIRRFLKRQDVEKPKLTLKGSTNMVVLVGSTYNEPGYEVSDNCTEKVEVKVDGKVDNKKVGTYTLTYTATDESGNSTSLKRTVRVASNTSSKGVIYLTFDDGPSATSTPKILEILKKKKVKATFFVINHDASLDYLIKQEYDEGHTVALHSYTHKYDKVYASVDAYFKDLTKIQDKVEKITGVKSYISRFPGGSSNTISRRYKKGIMTTLVKEVRDRGFHYFDWNVSSGDAGDVKTSDKVYKNVINGLSKSRSNVVLMHDFANNKKTVDALERIIDYGLENGYVFDKIDMTTPMVTHGVNN